MKRTVDEKLSYNRQYKGEFSVGYVLGVSVYRDYKKLDTKSKAIIRGMIADNKGDARKGDTRAKGFMCGVRDAANERKARQRGSPR